MEINKLKATIAAFWMLIMGAVAVLGMVTSGLGWVTIAGFTLLPTMALFWLWREPQESMSASIRKVLR